MSYYLISAEEIFENDYALEDLGLGDLNDIERIAVNPWSGADVKMLLKEKLGKTPSRELLESAVEYVKTYLANVEIGHYISKALDEFLKETDLEDFEDIE